MVSWGSFVDSTFEATEKKREKSVGFGDGTPASEGSLPVRRWRKVQSVQLQASNKKDGGEKWIPWKSNHHFL